MSYTPTVWATGDIVTAQKLNNLENGVKDVADNAIFSPSSPASGDFLVWNGSAWVAQSLSVWSGGNY